MKILGITLLLMLGITLGGCDKQKKAITHTAPPSPIEIKLSIEGNFKKMMNAAFEQNEEGYFSFIDNENFIGMDDFGQIIETTKTLRKQFIQNKKVIDNYELFEFDRIVTKPLSNTIVLVLAQVRVDITTITNQPLAFFGGYTQIWQLQQGNWRVISSSSTLRPVNKVEE